MLTEKTERHYTVDETGAIRTLDISYGGVVIPSAEVFKQLTNLRSWTKISHVAKLPHGFPMHVAVKDNKYVILTTETKSIQLKTYWKAQPDATIVAEFSDSIPEKGAVIVGREWAV